MGKIVRKIKTIISSLFRKLFKRPFKRLFLLIYFLFLILGSFLTLLYTFFHNLVFCSSLFGETFCTPLGIFLAMIVSIPGYVIAGNILTRIPQIPLYLSVGAVVLTSGAFYYFVGLFFDKLEGKKISVGLISKIIIVGAFILLIIFLLSLV